MRTSQTHLMTISPFSCFFLFFFSGRNLLKKLLSEIVTLSPFTGFLLLSLFTGLLMSIWQAFSSFSSPSVCRKSFRCMNEIKFRKHWQSQNYSYSNKDSGTHHSKLLRSCPLLSSHIMSWQTQVTMGPLQVCQLLFIIFFILFMTYTVIVQVIIPDF